jgi:hypothetical protein
MTRSSACREIYDEDEFVDASIRFRAKGQRRRRRQPQPLEEVNAEETAVIDGGEEQLTEIELESGSYALLCFIPDRAGGPPHVAKGMISGATVP